jgi:phage-related protein
MATFPAINPTYPASKRSDQERITTALGDGYESSLVFGLNTPRSEWDLTWLLELEAVQEVETFLQARADAGEWFEWQPPDSVTALRFRCDEWTIEQDNPITYRLSASFRRVFELYIPTLSPALASCQSDILCEGDYGDIGTDFWVSVMTAPFANAPWLYNPNFVGAVTSSSLVTDAMGNSYSLMSTTTEKFAITKRRLNGEVIWTKEHAFNDIFQTTQPLGDYIDETLICDIGNNKESIVCFLPSYFGYGHDKFAVYDTNGEFKLGMGIPGNTVTQGHTIGMEYIRLQKYIMMVRHELGYLTYDIVNANTGTLVTSWNISYGGLYYLSVWTANSSAFIQFDDGTSLLFDKRAAYLLVIRLDEDFVPISNSFDRYNANGSGVAVVRYGTGCLVATPEWLFYFDKSGNFISQTAIAQPIVKEIAILDDGIYLYSNGSYPQPNASMKSSKYSFDLSTLITENIIAGSNTNFVSNDSYGWHSDRGYHLPTNRVVASRNAFSNNAYINTGTYPVFQAFGGRASKVGGYTTLATNIYTASAQGFSRNTPLTTYYSPVGKVTMNGASTLRPVVPFYFSRTSVDASSTYQYNLYTTDLV